MTTYITFGPDHDDAHPAIGSRLSEGYLRIVLPGLEDQERNVAFQLLGPKFAFDYRNEPGADRPYAYRKGTIANVVLINEETRTTSVHAIVDTHRAVGAAELQALREARDMLAVIIGYTHQED